MNTYTNVRSVWLEAFSRKWKEAEVRARKDENGIYDKSWSLQMSTASEFAFFLAEELIVDIGFPYEDGYLSEREAAVLLNAYEDLPKSKVIVFNAGQAQVFADLDMSPIGPENYELPLTMCFFSFQAEWHTRTWSRKSSTRIKRILIHKPIQFITSKPFLYPG